MCFFKSQSGLGGTAMSRRSKPGRLSIMHISFTVSVLELCFTVYNSVHTHLASPVAKCHSVYQGHLNLSC